MHNSLCQVTYPNCYPLKPPTTSSRSKWPWHAWMKNPWKKCLTLLNWLRLSRNSERNAKCSGKSHNFSCLKLKPWSPRMMNRRIASHSCWISSRTMWLTRMEHRNRCGLQLRDSVLRTKDSRLTHRLKAPKTTQSSFWEKWRKWRRKFRFSMLTTSTSKSKYPFSPINAKRTNTKRV